MIYVAKKHNKSQSKIRIYDTSQRYYDTKDKEYMVLILSKKL